MASEQREEEQSEKAFTIADKRLFTKEGARRTPDSTPEPPPASPPPPPRRETPRAEEPRPPRPDPGVGSRGELPAADLGMLVNMLATNAMVFMGQIPAPGSQQYMRNLPQAQHMIDLLMVVREKTRGNLTADEEQLMQELLPQLQMAFVSVSRQVG